MKTFAMLLTLSALSCSTGAIAQTSMDPIESYCATMGEEDHFASDGYRLQDAAAIIRQDRANFHAFGKQDPSDEDDSTFGSKANRARLEAMLKRGSLSRADARAILNGTPDVCVDVYEDYINVFVN
ncbi:hypothetical protein Sa4125_44500 [Aureimonas sp. SA4125]|uniref:hypothetical protein n=1 Tax=Aureimonas sp. SA4125 TaxID=2826993 RepID=UPI001CC5EC1F|nr:hypothetical protein [Aureimonas sp. SA4125]BDA86908.1 hypothetical protein Sa4125_44500 [Aureimonas sp. SA4125]